MAYDDLRAWIAALDRAGELKRIRIEADPILEIAEITDRVSKAQVQAAFSLDWALPPESSSSSAADSAVWWDLGCGNLKNGRALSVSSWLALTVLSSCLDYSVLWPVSMLCCYLSVFWIAVDAFIIWYLLKPEVKAAFQQRPIASTASA